MSATRTRGLALVADALVVPMVHRYGGGMRCPYCHEVDDKVVDSRPADEGSAIRRRRECLGCSRRYTTYERLEELALIVVKRSGATEAFDRAKLEDGIARALSPSIAEGVAAAIAVEIEEELRTEGAEVPSDRIGLAVLERLRALDAVSYLRFASVYKGFEDLTDFEREVEVLQKTTEPKTRGIGSP